MKKKICLLDGNPIRLPVNNLECLFTSANPSILRRQESEHCSEIRRPFRGLESVAEAKSLPDPSTTIVVSRPMVSSIVSTEL